VTRESLIAASTFVPGDEREELLLVFAELAYERGYELVRLADVAERSRLPLASVLGYWSDEEACALDALRAASEQSFAAVARAFMSSPGDGAAAAHGALAALLDCLASSPALTSLSILAPPRLRRHAAPRHAGVLDVVDAFLGPALAAIGRVPPQPEVVSQIITGGLTEVLRRHAAESRLHELPAALPAISHVCVASFFGPDEAERVSHLPVP
jgi:AcrR family transcriptional regulator